MSTLTIIGICLVAPCAVLIAIVTVSLLVIMLLDAIKAAIRGDLDGVFGILFVLAIIGIVLLAASSGSSKPPQQQVEPAPTPTPSPVRRWKDNPVEMKITALAPWFGGKRGLAPKIVEQLGPHKCYWEPCVGGCSIIASKPPCSHETLNDLHGDMTNLIAVVASDSAPDLFERCLRTVCCDHILEQCGNLIRGGDYAGPMGNVERAWAFWCVCWMGRNGEMGLAKTERGRQVAVRWSGDGGGPGLRFKHAVDSLPAWAQRLRGVVVIRRDLFKVLDEIRDEAGTAIYLDPPYIAKSDRYEYDFWSAGGLVADDHDRMAEALQRFRKARVVVSYYAHERLGSLYPAKRWSVVDCSKAKHLSNTSSQAGIAPEVLIVNGDIF